MKKFLCKCRLSERLYCIIFGDFFKDVKRDASKHKEPKNELDNLKYWGELLIRWQYLIDSEMSNAGERALQQNLEGWGK